MGVLEDIKKMQQEGRSDEDIAKALSQKGISPEEISQAISESKVKAAVNQPAEEMQPSIMPPTPTPSPTPSPTTPQEETPQPSQPSPETYPAPTTEYAQPSPETYPAPAGNYPEEYTPPAAEYPETSYPAYQPTGLSPDTITEIAEQAIEEKLEDTTEKLKKISEFKTVIETKINGINTRLTRIEEIINRLQLSVLQKVGEYVTNVDDIKKEMMETQKSFKSLLSKSKK